MKVWITRARPGAEATAARLTARGFTAVIGPLLDVRPLSPTIDLTGIQALAFTSRNGVAAFARLSDDRSLPVFSVGDATARGAREAGFVTIRSAEGDLSALAALIRAEASGLTILSPTAAEPAGDLAALVGTIACVRAVAVYETTETATGGPDAWDTVLIHSPRAARALSAGSPPCAGRLAVAISPAAASPLVDLGFAEVRIAKAPTEDALLDALGKPGPGV
jgi:uroporphyrinogen-III synthase